MVPRLLAEDGVNLPRPGVPAAWRRRLLIPPRLGRAIGWSGAGVYAGWNLYWLEQGRLPPALFKGLTGWPAPTTGFTRALLVLGRGQWATSLGYNALAVPMLLLLAGCLLRLAAQACRGRRLCLPGSVLKLWGILLVVAWVLKLTGSRAYW